MEKLTLSDDKYDKSRKDDTAELTLNNIITPRHTMGCHESKSFNFNHYAKQVLWCRIGQTLERKDFSTRLAESLN